MIRRKRKKKNKKKEERWSLIWKHHRPVAFSASILTLSLALVRIDERKKKKRKRGRALFVSIPNNLSYAFWQFKRLSWSLIGSREEGKGKGSLVSLTCLVRAWKGFAFVLLFSPFVTWDAERGWGQWKRWKEKRSQLTAEDRRGVLWTKWEEMKKREDNRGRGWESGLPNFPVSQGNNNSSSSRVFPV